MKCVRNNHPPRLLAPPTSQSPQSLCEYTPATASSTRVFETSFRARLEPRLVTASPGSTHVAATNAATESVVPATTAHGRVRPRYRDASGVRTSPFGIAVPGAYTSSGSAAAYGCAVSHSG